MPLVLSRWSQTLGLLAASLLVAACGSSTTAALPTPDAAKPTLAPPATQPAPTPPAITPGSVHPALLKLEAGVEAIFTQAPAGAWDEVEEQLNQMTATWYEHGAEVSAAGAPQATLNSLDAALTDLTAESAAHDKAGTLQAANLVSAAAADLYDVYVPPPSGDLRRMAMLERQVWLDAACGDAHAQAQVMQGDFAQLKAVWERIAPQIRRAGSVAFAVQFDASLAAQARFIAANDTAGLKEEADRGLQLAARLR